jgi:hypothetical protein
MLAIVRLLSRRRKMLVTSVLASVGQEKAYHCERGYFSPGGRVAHTHKSRV